MWSVYTTLTKPGFVFYANKYFMASHRYNYLDVYYIITLVIAAQYGAIMVQLNCDFAPVVPFVAGMNEP